MQLYDIIFSGLLISLVLALVSLTFLLRWIRAEKSNVRIILSIIFLILLALSLLAIWWYILEITFLKLSLSSSAIVIAMFILLLFPLLRCTISSTQPRTFESDTLEQGLIKRNRASVEFLILALGLMAIDLIYEGRVTLFFVCFLLPSVIIIPFLLRGSSRSKET